MKRLIRLGGSALLLGAVVGGPLAVHASQRLASQRLASQRPSVHRLAPAMLDVSTSNTYFMAVVTAGPNAGKRIEGLLSLTAGTGTLTLGDGSQPVASAGHATSGMTLTVTLPNGTLKGKETSAESNTAAGTFTGPHAGDSGFWTADSATVLSFAINGAITSGPDRGKISLIGDLLAYAAPNGLVFGTYTDNSKASYEKPGYKPPVYPVHGTYLNGVFSATVAFAPRTTFGLVGRAGKFYGTDRLAGPLLGPNRGDVGSWAGAAQ